MAFSLDRTSAGSIFWETNLTSGPALHVNTSAKIEWASFHCTFHSVFLSSAWNRVKVNPVMTNYINEPAMWEGDFLVIGSVQAAVPDQFLMETQCMSYFITLPRDVMT